MSFASNSLTEILNEIRDELTNQISLANNIDAKIDDKKLLQQSNILNKIIVSSKVTEEEKSMLHRFSLTLQDKPTVRSLRYERQDLVRVLSNLNNS